LSFIKSVYEHYFNSANTFLFHIQVTVLIFICCIFLLKLVVTFPWSSLIPLHSIFQQYKSPFHLFLCIRNLSISFPWRTWKFSKNFWRLLTFIWQHCMSLKSEVYLLSIIRYQQRLGHPLVFFLLWIGHLLYAAFFLSRFVWLGAYQIASCRRKIGYNFGHLYIWTIYSIFTFNWYLR
jgi:hypothetical protein